MEALPSMPETGGIHFAEYKVNNSLEQTFEKSVQGAIVYSLRMNAPKSGVLW